MFLAPPKDERDLKHRDQKLVEILKMLSIRNKHSQSDVTFMLLLSEILRKVLNMIPMISNIEQLTIEHKLLRSVIVDKFLAVMDYALKANENPSVHEVFCNMFYYLLTSERLVLRQKLQLLNRFFILDGHNFLVKVIVYDNEKEAPVTHFKSNLVMAVVVNTLVKFLNKSTDIAKVLEKKSYDVVLKSNKKLMDPVNNDASHETMMMFVFMKFVDYTWKNPKYNKSEVFCNVSLILAVVKVKKMSIDPTFFHMLTILYTSTFRPITIKGNNLLEISSTMIMDSKHAKKIDLNYLMWWKVMGNPKKEEFKKAVADFVKQKEIPEIDNLQPGNLRLLDQKLMIEIFLGPLALPIAAHNNMKKVLCNFTTVGSQNDYRKFLEKFKEIQSEVPEKKKNQQQRLLNVMDVMNVKAENLSDTLKRETGRVLMKTLKARTTSQHAKLSAIQIATNLMSYKD